MNKTQLMALAAFITTLANGEAETAAPAAPETPAGDAPRRGRPPGKKEAPPADPEPEPAKKYTREELMAVVGPLMKATPSRKAEVAALIKQHGGTCLSDIPAENQQAFVDDAEALAI